MVSKGSEHQEGFSFKLERNVLTLCKNRYFSSKYSFIQQIQGLKQRIPKNDEKDCFSLEEFLEYFNN